MRLSRRARFLVVAAFIVFANALNLPDIGRIFGLGIAEYGFATDNGTVSRITLGEPADRAGLKIGDRVAVGDHSQRARYALVRGLGAYAGAPLQLSVLGTHPHRVVLHAVHEPPSLRALVAVRFALAAFTISVATALLLMRPEPATWGFFLYCLTVVTLPGAVSNYLLPSSVRPPLIAAVSFSDVLSPIGGILFAWTFAGQHLKGRVRTIVFAAALISVVYWCLQVAAMLGAFDFPNEIDMAFDALFFAAMLPGLADSYRRDDNASRQRLKWMVTALVISVPAKYVAGALFPSYISYGQYVALISLQAILPLVAAYAMFRKRVVDVKFVLSRTLVYGTITAATAGVFALLDEILNRTFLESNVGILIEVAVALLISFSLETVKKRLDSALDAVLFRDRHLAERQICQSAAAIVHASTEETIRAALVRLPVDALHLTLAALYKADQHVYRQVYAVGESSPLPRAIDGDDILVLSLRAQLHEIRLDEVPQSAAAHSRNAILAMPIAMRGDIAGFVVYGAHRNGADLDRDEVQPLHELAKNAATALDHIEAEALRSRVAALEKMVALSVPSSP